MNFFPYCINFKKYHSHFEARILLEYVESGIKGEFHFLTTYQIIVQMRKWHGNILSHLSE